jgi:hypothetical protein
MPKRELDIGATVHFARDAGSDADLRAEAPVYRVAHSLRLADGAMLYTIKSDAEPFERLVSASDLNRG